MSSLTLSSYTNGEQKRVHTVLYGGGPIMPVTEDYSVAEALWNREWANMRSGAKKTWDGDTCEELLVASKRG